MSSTRDIRRRIGSVDNTRQITKAMEMVAATKMRRAQEKVRASRDYAGKAAELLAAVTATGDSHGQPLLEARPVKKRAVLVMSSDRGLCGALNTNILRAALEAAGDVNTVFVPVGRKAQDGLRVRNQELLATFTGLLDTPHYSDILPVAELVISEFTIESVDEVLLVYPQFVSTLTNEAVVRPLLPAILPEGDSAPKSSALTMFEPSPEAVLGSLLPRLVEIQLFQALLETKASEHSSRMVAMRNATNNASDLLDELRFSYNQARQAAITTEIAEIAAASAA